MTGENTMRRKFKRTERKLPPSLKDEENVKVEMELHQGIEVATFQNELVNIPSTKEEYRAEEILGTDDPITAKIVVEVDNELPEVKDFGTTPIWMVNDDFRLRLGLVTLPDPKQNKKTDLLQMLSVFGNGPKPQKSGIKEMKAFWEEKMRNLNADQTHERSQIVLNKLRSTDELIRSFETKSKTAKEVNVSNNWKGTAISTFPRGSKPSFPDWRDTAVSDFPSGIDSTFQDWRNTAYSTIPRGIKLDLSDWRDTPISNFPRGIESTFQGCRNTAYSTIPRGIHDQSTFQDWRDTANSTIPRGIKSDLSDWRDTPIRNFPRGIESTFQGCRNTAYSTIPRGIHDQSTFQDWRKTTNSTIPREFPDWGDTPFSNFLRGTEPSVKAKIVLARKAFLEGEVKSKSPETKINNSTDEEVENLERPEKTEITTEFPKAGNPEADAKIIQTIVSDVDTEVKVDVKIEKGKAAKKKKNTSKKRLGFFIRCLLCFTLVPKEYEVDGGEEEEIAEEKEEA